jgi:hypothetical protein
MYGKHTVIGKVLSKIVFTFDKLKLPLIPKILLDQIQFKALTAR